MSEIRDFVMQQPFFNSHEHQSVCDWQWEQEDHTTFLGYAWGDRDTSKLPGSQMSLADQMQAMSTTGYGQALELLMQDFFGVSYDGEREYEMTALLKAWIKEHQHINIQEHLFRDRANCIAVIADVNNGTPVAPVATLTDPSVPEYVRFAVRLGPRGLFEHSETSEICALEEEWGCSLNTLFLLEQEIETYLQTMKSTGKLTCLKIALAYTRPLNIKAVDRVEAEKCYDLFCRGKTKEIQVVHDYLVHIQLRWAEANALPVQVHTGHLAGLNRDMRNGDPAHLVPLIMQYPNVCFDLFHGSWPWGSVASSMAKEFPNVCLDLCWAWALSPWQTEHTLDEWLGAVPHNKILAFGGDSWSGFATVGYAQQARIGIANCLERHVQRGHYSQSTAEMIARRIMTENGFDIFPGFIL